MAEILNPQIKNWKSGVAQRDWTSLGTDQVKIAAGYRWANSNWVACIKLILPTPAKAITLSICNAPDGFTGKQNLKYTFSKAEDDALVSTLSDLNTVDGVPSDGSFTLNPGAYARNEVTFDKTLEAGTHYLYIWTQNSKTTSNAMWIFWWSGSDKYSALCTYEELEGLNWIKDSVGVRPYHSQIQVNGVPTIATPYVFTGGEWKLLS